MDDAKREQSHRTAFGPGHVVWRSLPASVRLVSVLLLMGGGLGITLLGYSLAGLAGASLGFVIALATDVTVYAGTDAWEDTPRRANRRTVGGEAASAGSTAVRDTCVHGPSPRASAGGATLPG